MLTLSYLRENRDEAIKRLSVKNFKNPELIDQVIKIDDHRKSLQFKSDELLNESKQIARERKQKRPVFQPGSFNNG